MQERASKGAAMLNRSLSRMTSSLSPSPTKKKKVAIATDGPGSAGAIAQEPQEEEDDGVRGQLAHEAFLSEIRQSQRDLLAAAAAQQAAGVQQQPKFHRPA